MANCINYDCDDILGTHTPNDCDEELLGGSDAMVLLECNHQLTDPSNATQINAEIAAGRARMITGVKIGINERSPVQVEANKVGVPQRLVNYDQSGSMIDANVNPDNVDFYSQLTGGKTLGGIIANLKGTESATQHYVLFIDAAISFTGSMPIKNNNDENIKFTSTFNWRDKDLPSLHSAPVGIF